MRLIFERSDKLTADISTFWFKTDHKPDFIAGQFIDLHIPHAADKRGERRWFTVSSSPTDELLSITTRLSAQPSSFKKNLLALKNGDTLYASQPMGDFVLPRDPSIPLLFVAFGIGVTPVKSILSYLEASNDHRKIHVLYAARTADDLIFTDLIKHFDTDAEYFVSESLRSRKLTTHDVLRAASLMENPFIFISGPEERVEVLVAELQEAGTKGSRLVTDYFQGYGEA